VQAPFPELSGLAVRPRLLLTIESVIRDALTIVELRRLSLRFSTIDYGVSVDVPSGHAGEAQLAERVIEFDEIHDELLVVASHDQ
jgi:hypothetical protein